MITKLSHSTVYVDGQDAAVEFYTGKLGFELRQDVRMDGFRWVTVGPKDQADVEMVLADPRAMLDADTAAALLELVAKGALGAGVFATDDCQATFQELSGRGVTFIESPQERPYGVEALFRDNSGNWFSLTQRKV